MDKDEYFFVKGKLTINVEPVAPSEVPTTQQSFINEIPKAFAVASQCSHLDIRAQKQVEQISSTHAVFEQLLSAQNDKINLLLSFMLMQLDNKSQRFITDNFGASGLEFISQSAFIAGQAVRLKLFLTHPVMAIYCYGKVIQCHAENQQYKVKVVYSHLQEQDRDVLIRTALFFQQKLLRKRAQFRKGS